MSCRPTRTSNDPNDPNECYAERVKRQIAYAVILAVALPLAACRQADGPMPASTAATANEIGDISRDLQNLASGSPEGPKDLSDDIGHYAEDTNGGQAAAAELSRRLGEALQMCRGKRAAGVGLSQRRERLVPFTALESIKTRSQLVAHAGHA